MGGPAEIKSWGENYYVSKNIERVYTKTYLGLLQAKKVSCEVVRNNFREKRRSRRRAFSGNDVNSTDAPVSNAGGDLSGESHEIA